MDKESDSVMSITSAFFTLAAFILEPFAIGSVLYAYLSPSDEIQVQYWACVVTAVAILRRT